MAKRIYVIGADDPATADFAIALVRSGNSVAVADVNIAEPLRAKLLKVSVSMTTEITSGSEVVIGPKVPANSKELNKAQALQLSVSSIAEFIALASRQKQRVVITGTTGKNIIALLVIHTLAFHKRSFDYSIGSVPQSKDSVVSLSEAPLIIIEGQDVSTSALDKTPEFLKYHHHIGVISDIESSREEYIRSFSQFETLLPKSGILIYNEKDSNITKLLTLNHPDVLYVPYAAHPSTREGGQEFLITDKEHYPLKAPGSNGLLNMNAAKETLKKVGITSSMFYQAIRSFQAPNR